MSMEMRMQDHSKTFSTSDLGTAVFLFTSGHALVDTKLIDSRRLSFIFLKQPNTETKVKLYLLGQAEAPALRLFENYRHLRALTFRATGMAR
jgi:hypothetical protein